MQANLFDANRPCDSMQPHRWSRLETSSAEHTRHQPRTFHFEGDGLRGEGVEVKMSRVCESGDEMEACQGRRGREEMSEVEKDHKTIKGWLMLEEKETGGVEENSGHGDIGREREREVIDNVR
jgi:hypothetical protein